MAAAEEEEARRQTQRASEAEADVARTLGTRDAQVTPTQPEARTLGAKQGASQQESMSLKHEPASEAQPPATPRASGFASAAQALSARFSKSRAAPPPAPAPAPPVVVVPAAVPPPAAAPAPAAAARAPIRQQVTSPSAGQQAAPAPAAPAAERAPPRPAAPAAAPIRQRVSAAGAKAAGAGAAGEKAGGAPIRQRVSLDGVARAPPSPSPGPSSFSVLLSSLELSDTHVYEH